MPATHPHLGKKIKELVRKSGMTINEFADKINCSRRNVYVLFGKQSMDTEQLFRISKTLNYDFFSFFSKEEKITYEETRSKNHKKSEEHPTDPEEYITVLDYYKSQHENLVREITYLKEIVALLKKKK